MSPPSDLDSLGLPHSHDIRTPRKPSGKTGMFSLILASHYSGFISNQNLPNPNSENWFDFEQLDLKVKSVELNTVFPPFCFQSSSVGSEIADESVFSDPVMEPDLVCDGGCLWWLCRRRCRRLIILWLQRRNLWVQKSDLMEMISAATSVTNSRIWNGDWDIISRLILTRFSPLPV